MEDAGASRCEITAVERREYSSSRGMILPDGFVTVSEIAREVNFISSLTSVLE